MSIYEPDEDSFLMSETLKLDVKNKDIKFLEIGSGSGINLETAKSIGIRDITGTDINPEAVEHCNKLGFNCILSDLFKNVKGKFDLIVFNPPYLPFDKKEPKSSQTNTTGGLQGNEIIIKFLKQAKRHLAEDGRIFVITSSLSEGIDFSGLGYIAKELNRKNLFFETLSIWDISRE